MVFIYFLNILKNIEFFSSSVILACPESVGRENVRRLRKRQTTQKWSDDLEGRVGFEVWSWLGFLLRSK